MAERVSPLNPEQRAAIVDALEAGRDTTIEGLVKRFGLGSASQFFRLLRFVRQQGSWCTPIRWCTCVHCGQPMAVPAHRAKNWRAHPRCRKGREAERQQHRRASSTPEEKAAWGDARRVRRSRAALSPLGERVRELRLARGLTQSQLGERGGGQALVSALENGLRKVVSPADIDALAAGLEVEPEALWECIPGGKREGRYIPVVE